MRIGEFCEKHSITQDTVRYYINIGLLIPRKDGHHYRFDHSHNEDIEKILGLKKLDFSILEIQRILNFDRLAGKSSKEYKDYFIRILEDKKKEIIQYEKKYKEIKSTLEKSIKDIENKGKKIQRKLGINIDSLEILQCPICNKSLNISDGNIENNMIINGRVLCVCGYKAQIKDGIYSGVSCEENFSYKKEIPSKLDFLESSSTEFINFYYDGMSEMMNKIESNSKSPKYVLELENCSGTFLMQHIERLKKETTYILINSDKNRLEKLKENLELHNNHERFIFICEEYNNLPIKHNFIDIIIDNWMTKDYVLEKKDFLLDILTKHLKTGGLLVGTYAYFEDIHTQSYVSDLEKKGYFNTRFLSKKFKNLGFKEDSIIKIDPIIDQRPYDGDIKNKKLYSYVYTCIKK